MKKISVKQNNEKHLNGLKSLWEVWCRCISQGVFFLSSTFYLFLNLTCIPSWFKQQQEVIVWFKVAGACVIAVFIGKPSSKLQEQLLNSPVLSQNAVPCLICVCLCGMRLLKLWVLCWDCSWLCPPTPFFLCNHSPLSAVWQCWTKNWVAWSQERAPLAFYWPTARVYILQLKIVINVISKPFHFHW